MRSSQRLLATAIGSICITLSCNPNPQPTVTPVPFPSVSAPGFRFPEGQPTVYGWLEENDWAAVANHSWGIWAGLTMPSGQTHGGQPLYVYDTWNGVGELSGASARGERDAGCRSTHSGRVTLEKPKQFAHGGLMGAAPTSDYAILESVAYSPDAACFATSNLLFNQSVLDGFRVEGDIGKTPEFPVRSITTKPTYYVVKARTGLVRLPAWTKTPEPAKVYGHSTWGNYVYVDLDNRQEPNKPLVPVTTETPTPEQIAAATVNMSDFLGFRLDGEAAAYLNRHQDKGLDPAHQFHEGDVALLVAMHVTTKEIKNWTWQTYFWASDPKAPGAPSSPEVAALMPDAVTGAARHYAVSPCYQMVTPNQPVTDGSDVGTDPVICYNPYLEAGFGPKVFSFENKNRPDFEYGVQTNCMSCHALATASGKLGYTTDQYVDMANPAFVNEVQLDFAWSVQGNLNQDK